MKNIKWKFVFLIVFLLGAFYFVEKRSFYYNKDKTECITIWKRLGGKCLVIPGKYIGLWKPSGEYLETTNKNSLTFVWKRKMTDQLVICNNYGAPVDLSFKSYKVKYYDYKQREDFINTYYINHNIKVGYEYLSIDILENYVVLNGRKM
ncbi:hypothetical protein [Pedobacter cryoconitis]|uniref:hypothetical protein n=1 Tax=Pedobacter cryoconitis TaxID=188932 RepID=UPI001610AB5D|nr:hypothetical protein [Pedobacter cryoconitis]MBB5647912.1 hypothetical protein [Pedobacter cryoconitis]